MSYIMEDLIIWRTYHKDELVDLYSLKDESPYRLYNSNNHAVLGENINKLNPFYSEIVTLYWVWKNRVQSKYVGFCHYRRIFPQTIELEDDEVQVLDALNLGMSVSRHYKLSHNYNDLYDIFEILNRIYGKGNQYVDYMLNSHVFVPYCSFIMQYEKFEQMCEYLFPILFEFDRMHGLNMDPERYMSKAIHDFRFDDVKYQCRAMSFLAERLISAYLLQNMKVFYIASLQKSYWVKPTENGKL